MRKNRTWKKVVSYVLAGAMVLTSAGFAGTQADAASSVKLNKTKATLAKKGKTVTLKVTAASSKVKIKSTTWKAPSKKIATVTSKGVVKAVWAGDVKKVTNIKCTVKFTKGSSKKVYKKVLKCKVTVKAQATDTPSTTTPATDTPSTETPATDTPATDTPATDTPNTEAPETEAPTTDTPNTETPNESTAPSEAPSNTPAESAAPSNEPADTLTQGSPVPTNINPAESTTPDYSADVETKVYTANGVVAGEVAISKADSDITANSLVITGLATGHAFEVAIESENGIKVNSYDWTKYKIANTNKENRYKVIDLNPGTLYTFAIRTAGNGSTTVAGPIAIIDNGDEGVRTKSKKPELSAANVDTEKANRETDAIHLIDINPVDGLKKFHVVCKSATSGAFEKASMADAASGGTTVTAITGGSIWVTGLKSGTKYTLALELEDKTDMSNTVEAETLGEFKVSGTGTYKTAIVSGTSLTVDEVLTSTASDILNWTVTEETTKENVSGYKVCVKNGGTVTTSSGGSIDVTLKKDGFEDYDTSINIKVKFAAPTTVTLATGGSLSTGKSVQLQNLATSTPSVMQYSLTGDENDYTDVTSSSMTITKNAGTFVANKTVIYVRYKKSGDVEASAPQKLTVKSDNILS